MKTLVLLLKIFPAVFIVYYAANNVDFTTVKGLLDTANGVSLIAIATSLMLLQAVFAGVRLAPISELFDTKLTPSKGIQTCMLGNFFSQFLFSFVGGDTIRVIALSKCGIRAGQAVRLIFLDRVFGFIALQILFLLSLPFLLKLLESNDSIYWGIISLATMSVCMIIGFFVMGIVPNKDSNMWVIKKFLDISSISRFLYKSKSHTFKIFTLSMLMHICSLYAIYILTNNLGAHISISQVFCIGSAVILLSLLPISIAGWGVREGAMVVGFNLIGIPSEIALTVSIILGLSLLIASLPGALVLLFGQYKTAEASA